MSLLRVLLNARTEAGTHVVGWGLEWGGVAWAALLVAGAGALAWHVYLRGEKRPVLFALRLLVMALLAIGATAPKVRLDVESQLRQQVIVLVDASRSMALTDGVVEGKAASRLAEVKASLPSALAKLGEKYDVRVALFGERVREGSIEGASAADAKTGLGDAISEAVSRARGQPLGGIVVATDGNSNSGTFPLAAARAAKTPVLAWGLGAPTAVDLALDDLSAASVAFARDEVTAELKGRATGLAGKTTTLHVRLGDQEVGAQQLPVGADGGFTAQVKFAPKEAGSFQLSVVADTLAGERVAENNVASTRLRVVDGKLKVLYVERQPRWEFKYLQAILERDRRVEATFVLTDGAESLADAPSARYMKDVPANVEAYAGFDLLILGDVDPAAVSAEAQQSIATYVERLGGAIVFIAGREKMPSAWAGTPVERMLPVELAEGMRPAQQTTDPEVIDITPPGREAAMLRLADDAAGSAETWKSLPAIYWTAEVSRAKAASEVLLTAGGKPLVVQGRYGVGKTLFVGTDNFWRMRKNVGDEIHARLWGQVVQAMGMSHLLGEGQRTQLSAAKARYEVGESAGIAARMFTPKFEPVLSQAAKVTVTRPDKTTATVTLNATGQAGTYQGAVELTMAGEYTVVSAEDPKARPLVIFARESDLEMRTIAMNRPLLEDMAKASGGAFLTRDDLPNIERYLSGNAGLSRATVRAEVWSSPAYFGLVLAGAAGEWWARRKRGMK